MISVGYVRPTYNVFTKTLSILRIYKNVNIAPINKHTHIATQLSLSLARTSLHAELFSYKSLGK